MQYIITTCVDFNSRTQNYISHYHTCLIIFNNDIFLPLMKSDYNQQQNELYMFTIVYAITSLCYFAAVVPFQYRVMEWSTPDSPYYISSYICSTLLYFTYASKILSFPVTTSMQGIAGTCSTSSLLTALIPCFLPSFISHH